jgi:hypothetical protein
VGAGPLLGASQLTWIAPGEPWAVASRGVPGRVEEGVTTVVRAGTL